MPENARRLLAALVAAWTVSIAGQAPPPAPAPAPGAPPHRPRIGLVLSGGGARGVTHLGVLKELERLHVPIDCIAGTSMGAVVGGLYASGMGTDEIEKVLLGADWEEIFTDRPPRRELTFSRKEDDRRYVVGFVAGLDSRGFHVAKGLIPGQQLSLLLQTLTLPVARVRDFEGLPIPFRCAATDIVTGDKVILSGGSLASAIRASMSLPAIFAPVERDGRLLVDGGLVDNLPVDAARAMGADVVIAVDIGTPPLKRDQLTSPLAVSSQMIAILMQKNVEASSAQADILLRPDLKGFSSMNFRHAAPLVALGEEAVEASAPGLERLALPPEAYAAWRRRVDERRPQPPTVDFVSVEGASPRGAAAIRKYIRTAPGRPLEPATLERDLTRIYNSGSYDLLDFRMAQEGGKEGVVIQAKPSPMGPVQLRLGLRLSTDFQRQSDAGVLAGLRWTRLNGLGLEWKTDAELGLNRRLDTELRQPLDRRGRWFVAPVAEYQSLLDDVFLGEDVARYRASRADVGLDLGFNLGHYGEVRVGPRWGHDRFSPEIGQSEIFQDFSVSTGGWSLKAILDHLDAPDLPSRGYLLDVDAYFARRYMGSEVSYNRAALAWHGFATRGRHTLSAGLSAGTALGSDLPVYEWFWVGGFDSFAGYQRGQLLGPYYAVARLGYTYRLADLPIVVGRGVYLMAFTEAGNAWLTTADIAARTLRYSGTLAIATSTKFGPLIFGYSYAKGGFDQVTLTMGKRF